MPGAHVHRQARGHGGRDRRDEDGNEGVYIDQARQRRSCKDICTYDLFVKARSSDGPAGMVFDAVFNTPDVGSAPAVDDPPPAEPPKQEVSTN